MMVGLVQNDLLNWNSEDPREVFGDRLPAPGYPVIPEGIGRANVTISEMMNMVIMRMLMVDPGHLSMMIHVITVSGMSGVILTMLNIIGPLSRRNWVMIIFLIVVRQC